MALDNTKSKRKGQYRFQAGLGKRWADAPSKSTSKLNKRWAHPFESNANLNGRKFQPFHSVVNQNKRNSNPYKFFGVVGKRDGVGKNGNYKFVYQGPNMPWGQS